MRWRKLAQLVGAISLLSMLITFAINRGTGPKMPVGCVSDPGEIKEEIDVGSAVNSIACIINGGRRLNCYKDRNTSEVFVPFNSFLSKSFDVTGQIVNHEHDSVFEWTTSYAKIPIWPKSYSWHGVFGSFASYNVEGRERVKCISPISEPAPVYFEVTHSDKEWRVEDHKQQTITINQPDDVNIESKDYNLGVSISVDHQRIVQTSDRHFPIVEFEAIFAENSGFTLHVTKLDTNTKYHILYIPKELVDCVKFMLETNDIVYAMGEDLNGWKKISRNYVTDLSRGLSAIPIIKGKGSKKGKHTRLGPTSVRLDSIVLHGSVHIRALRLASANHIQSFMAAADWMIQHQTNRGGWPVPVQRSLADGKLVLKPDWYSAMAQGHAISLLVRAYYKTKQMKYLNAARKATKLFEVNANEGGVKNSFLGKTDWYEEYPTSPGSFVLNGFIYSLVGLYDLSTLESELKMKNGTAESLYTRGLESLKTLLPLFDTGSGSTYDLRHFSLQGEPPNLARWDYHAVHVYQLSWLYIIQNDPLFYKFADRWKRYMQGEKAKHN